MGAALPIAAVALQVVGSVAQGVTERNAAYRAAGDNYENARLSILAGEQEGTQILDDERTAAGASLAQQGGRGIALNGSISTLIEQSAFNAEKHLAAVRQQAFGEATNYNRAGDENIRQGKTALAMGMFNAVSAAVNGAAGIRNQRRLEAQGNAERSARLGGTASGGVN